MPPDHRFGGRWTEDKLTRLQKYLQAYTTIFARNPRASKLTTTYVDAFAGTGYRIASKAAKSSSLPLFDDEEARLFQRGSARIALETEPSFHRYLFIDDDAEHVMELETLRKQFPQKAERTVIVQEEANSFLVRWAEKVRWDLNRAVVFLDPYGMEVEWKTIEGLARTKAIDLWILFPLGQAVNRLLTRESPPKGQWANRLTRCFGTDEWKEAFYRKEYEETLFGAVESLTKEADFRVISDFFVRRLSTIFERIAKRPLPLRNSKNIPIYLLCFAASNPKGAPTAVKIANHILGR